MTLCAYMWTWQSCSVAAIFHFLCIIFTCFIHIIYLYIPKPLLDYIYKVIIYQVDMANIAHLIKAILIFENSSFCLRFPLIKMIFIQTILGTPSSSSVGRAFVRLDLWLEGCRFLSWIGRSILNNFCSMYHICLSDKTNKGPV